MLARSALGLVCVYVQPSSTEDRRATVGEQIPSRAAAPGQRPGQGEMRGLGAIALSSRASLQPPFAMLPVTGHVRLSPKILRHRRRAQTAEPDGATTDSGPRLRHRGPRSEHARSRRALAWASPSPSEVVRLCEAPHSHESAPQTAEPDGATADSGPRLRHRGHRSEHVRSRRALAWASPSPSEAVHLFEAPHSHESAPQTAEPDGATADSSPRLRCRGSFFRGSMKLSNFVSPSSAAPGRFQPECAVPVRRESMRRTKCFHRRVDGPWREIVPVSIGERLYEPVPPRLFIALSIHLGTFGDPVGHNARPARTPRASGNKNRRLRCSAADTDAACPSCGQCSDRWGDHAVLCPCGGDGTIRHNAVRNVCFQEAASAAARPELEKAGLLPRRPAEDALPASGGERRLADIWLPRGVHGTPRPWISRPRVACKPVLSDWSWTTLATFSCATRS